MKKFVAVLVGVPMVLAIFPCVDCGCSVTNYIAWYFFMLLCWITVVGVATGGG
jgi:hypothetical protein